VGEGSGGGKEEAQGGETEEYDLDCLRDGFSFLSLLLGLLDHSDSCILIMLANLLSKLSNKLISSSPSSLTRSPVPTLSPPLLASALASPALTIAGSTGAEPSALSRVTQTEAGLGGLFCPLLFTPD
jgi:hypothetical protein